PAAQAIHSQRTGTDRRGTRRLAACTCWHRGLSNRRGYPGWHRYERSVVKDNGVAEVTRLVLYRRGAGRHWTLGRLQLSVGLGLGLRSSPICLKRSPAGPARIMCSITLRLPTSLALQEMRSSRYGICSFH